MSPSSSPLPPLLPSSPAPTSLVEPSSPSAPSPESPPSSPSSSSSDDLAHRKLPVVESSSVDSSSSPLSRRSHALPKTHRRRHLHLPVPHRGGTGGPHHRSGTHHPLTRPRSPTPLHPSAEERRPLRRPCSQTPGSSPGWSRVQRRSWRNQRMWRPWQEKGKRDCAVAISLRKEMDARCVDARLNKG
jgi:hypothetical protein